MTATTQAPATREYAGTQIPLAGTYAIDTSHSRIGFVVKHLVVARTRGSFTAFEGTLTLGEDPLTSTADLVIQAASITTGDDTRDNAPPLG